MNNNLFNIMTPAQGQAEAVKSRYGLENHGLTGLHTVYWNLPPEALYEEIIFRSEAKITHQGALVVNTGKHSARSANDKFIVREASTEGKIWWGEYNRPFSEEKFNLLFHRLRGYLQGRDLFVQDCYGGADPNYRLPVRIITEYAWHSLFAHSLLTKPETPEEIHSFVPEFTIMCIPSFKAEPQTDGTQSPTFILLNYGQKLCLIGNTGYAGEIKKSVFTLLNFLLPLQGIMTMHCSANIGKAGDTALFFGLSGTGKTSLSADPNRALIGDDEHGWSDDGVFNFENGCYAKVIRLSPTAEPQIYACTRRFGTILENVVFDPVSRMPNLDDSTLTENTRAGYPLSYIDNAVANKMGGHPKNIFMLTCDANGVMPPIARLTPEQAMYYFISGYTSKVSGTEVGLSKEPEATFSTCFGAPFMVHHPYKYAEMLRGKMTRFGAQCWLVNTGWSGGPYGVGKRMSIAYTRTLLNAALEGKLNNVEYLVDPVFQLAMPKHCEGVPEKVLNPEQTWGDPAAYRDKRKMLAALFSENIKKYADGCPPEIIKAGPAKG